MHRGVWWATLHWWQRVRHDWLTLFHFFPPTNKWSIKLKGRCQWNLMGKEMHFQQTEMEKKFMLSKNKHWPHTSYHSQNLIWNIHSRYHRSTSKYLILEKTDSSGSSCLAERAVQRCLGIFLFSAHCSLLQHIYHGQVEFVNFLSRIN